jgi:hypothetical protein
MKIIDEVFMGQIFNIPYDKFNLEVRVEKMQKKHNVKCSFCSKGNHKEAYESIFRFFNELVWFYHMRISDVNGGHSQGSHVFLNYSANSERYLLYFSQKVHEQKQHLALGFFREALCNESPYYRFLCFDKILQTPFSSAKFKGEWIVAQIPSLADELAKNFRDRRIKELSNKTLADWLYEDGRHALVHATLGRFIRNPNNYDDWDQIKWANTVMEDLARKCITDKLGVPNP